MLLAGTIRCEIVPWIIRIVDVDMNKRSCGDKAFLGRIVLPPEDDKAIEVAVGCYVRYASAVEDTPRGTILITGRWCADSDTWVNPRERDSLPMAGSCSG